MKKITTLLIIAIVLVACSTEKKKEVATVNLDQYPEELVKVFNAHGGIDNWNKQQTLTFKKGDEKHTIDLKARKSLIEAPKYTIGYDGKEPWVVKEDSTSFKGDPGFYHNLYFYFYAMPFVLSDDGINYSEAKPITVDGKSYPGVKISFNDGVGASSKDNYYIYYNKDSHQMEWLGYTVTYHDNKAKDETSIIKYNDWQTVDGIKLPKELIWYKKDSLGTIVAPRDRKPLIFTDATLSTEALDATTFEKK
ncbi:hypothetical protein JM658_10975 [Joostella atrarenae]|uniref:Threonine synthase n=1 Tax=Joostella atrarenae TaxID=679257 RepID=A0ABS9J4J8_9FLAO|nr:DUF6503 family protein [Joostella atrarenae]MCF8715351.1 hypothetical protein [Joostella atrarenae]